MGQGQRAVFALAVVLVAASVYLFVWAALWPWGDMRRTWAVFFGSLGFVVGGAALAVSARWWRTGPRRRGWVFAVTGTVLAPTALLVALAIVAVNA